jgi:hypothetical protein
MNELRFTACKNLDFDKNHYTATLARINTGGTTKLVWERRDCDGKLQLCQFCKLNGRHNDPTACLDYNSRECSEYDDFRHVIDSADIPD